MSKKVKSVFLYLLMLVFVICNNMIVSADSEATKVYDYSEYTREYIPENLSSYFQEIHLEVITGYLLSGKFESDVSINSIEIGVPFTIYAADSAKKENEVWYYPIYHDDEIKFMFLVYEHDGELNWKITTEFVDRLNEIEFTDDMLIVNEQNKFFVVDGKNNKYFLQEYSDSSVENQISLQLNNSSLNLLSETSILSKQTRTAELYSLSGAVENMGNGYKCIMTDCFVRQFEDPICWAAAATIIRYLKPEYEDLTAKGVAYKVGDYSGIDISTEEGKKACLVGRDTDDTQFALALYGIYYSLLDRKLTYSELKDEINNGAPLLMLSVYHNEKTNEDFGHITVIYGYYTYGSIRYIMMWNPGTGEEEAFEYKLDGTTEYYYSSCYFEWNSTICNGAYVVK